jgi:hypothetical protein
MLIAKEEKGEKGKKEPFASLEKLMISKAKMRKIKLENKEYLISLKSVNDTEKYILPQSINNC